MSNTRWSGWLTRTDGVSLGIPPRGLVLGRRLDCDVVLDSPKASQVHALITPTLVGLELLAVGRNPTRVDGTTVASRCLLKDGATLRLPGAEFVVKTIRSDEWSVLPWVVRDPDGHQYALRRLPFSIGGGLNDHLQIQDWPERAVELHAAGGAIVGEFSTAAVLGGEPISQDAVETLQDGDTITVGRKSVQLRWAEVPSRETTVLLSESKGAHRVVFRFLPAGGEIELHYSDETTPRVVVLAELRARLLAALLSPPTGYKPGEIIPDELLIPAIWSRSADRSRVDLNVLIYRTRKALVKEGLNPERVFARARTGGGTRFLLSPNATVEID